MKSASRNDHRLPYDQVYGPRLLTREWASCGKAFPTEELKEDFRVALLQAFDAGSESERQVIDLVGDLLGPS